MKKIDYAKLIDKVQDYGINAFYRDCGVGGNMAFVYKIIRGGNISLKSLDRCCEFFDCDIKDLIEVVDDD